MSLCPTPQSDSYLHERLFPNAKEALLQKRPDKCMTYADQFQCQYSQSTSYLRGRLFPIFKGLFCKRDLPNSLSVADLFQCQNIKLASQRPTFVDVFFLHARGSFAKETWKIHEVCRSISMSICRECKEINILPSLATFLRP